MGVVRLKVAAWYSPTRCVISTVPYGPWFDAGLTLLFPNGLVRRGICAGDGSVVCKRLGPLGCRVTFYRGPKCMGTYLYEDPVDCRNNIRGLATVVDHELDHKPFGNGLYTGTNRPANIIKCHYWKDHAFYSAL